MGKILVVDDSATIRLTLKRALIAAGFEVMEAVDGVDGLNKLASDGASVSLILSDINMPNMDGLTMCQKIKETASLSSIPIFIISTEGGVDMKTKGKELGITAWMNKPPNPTKLVEAVMKILQKSSTTSASV